MNHQTPTVEQVEDLTRASQRGDLAAFNQLVLVHQHQVFNVCLRILGDPASAEDVTQEAFLSAFRRIDTYRGGNFRAWLLRIATNGCYDALRRKGRRPASSIDALYEDSDSPPIPDTQSVGPELAAEQGEMRTAVRRALARIPDDQRTVVVLCDLQGLSYEEIAATLGVNIGTVKSRINRGRARLRELLTRSGEPRDGESRPTSGTR
ncbi:MAG: sigma-70 family RNA polymerase sigma factor [Dehalococcoidia bacterium]|nr:sigma-70 family RNA polymerase sigma factor [Dehalococcoidia bacterium]